MSFWSNNTLISLKVFSVDFSEIQCAFSFFYSFVVGIFILFSSRVLSSFLIPTILKYFSDVHWLVLFHSIIDGFFNLKTCISVLGNSLLLYMYPPLSFLIHSFFCFLLIKGRSYRLTLACIFPLIFPHLFFSVLIFVDIFPALFFKRYF